MKVSKLSFFLGIAAVLVAFGCLGAGTSREGKFDLVPTASSGAFYLLDRDTGTVNLVFTSGDREPIIYHFRTE